MKLAIELIEYIETVIKTCITINIENVIIEQGLVRGIDEGRTVVLYQTENVPDMPFGSVGMSRLNVLMSRINTARTQDNFSVDVLPTSEEEDEYAKSIIMRATNTKIDYRCNNPATIQAPKSINDRIVYRIQLNAEAVALMQSGQGAMGSDTINIAYDEDGVYFEYTDINSDVFKHTFTDTAEMLEDDVNSTFNHRYPTKTLLSLFKQNPDGHFDIGEKGILTITINGLDVYVLPQV